MEATAAVPPFSLDELMAFLGILLYMAVVDKGEYRNYWGRQIEESVFGISSERCYNLSETMPILRFKHIRRVFCIRHVPQSMLD